MDQSSVSSSFYEAPVVYDEEKTKLLYENLRKNFQEINDSLKNVRENMDQIQKESSITVKLIEKIEAAKREKEENREED